jgi:hypothetical protein
VGRCTVTVLASVGLFGLVAAPSGAAYYPYNSIATGSPARVVAIGDLNGDGRTDVAVGTRSGGDGVNDQSVLVLLQAPDGKLSAAVRYATGLDAKGISTGDLNGDGRDDLAVCGGSGVAVLRQQADGSLEPARFTATGEDAVGTQIGDLNGDGRADLAVCHGDEPQISVFYQSEAGELLPPRQYPVPRSGHGEIEIGDVTSDGLADLVFVHGQTDGPNFWVLRQDPITHVLGLAGGYGLTLADLNSDGRTDVAVSWGGYQPDCGLDIFYQGTHGTLQTPVRLRSSDVPEPVASADLNGDGLADLVVTHGGWQNLGTFLQLPDGTFAPEALDPLPSSNRYDPQSLALGDLNGDGAPDVALADGGNGLVVLYNAGDTDFTPPDTAILEGARPYSRETSASFQFIGLDEASPANELQYAWGLDNGAWSPFAGSTTVRLTGLMEGAHTFVVVARDAASNLDPSPAEYRFVVDLTPPDDLSVRGLRTYTAAEGVIVYATARDNLAESRQLTFAWRVDGERWSDFSPASKLTLYSLFEGPHLVEVKAADPAGNVSVEPARASFFVDRTPPETRITSVKRNPATGSTVVSFGGDDNLPAPNRLTFSWRLDDGEWSPFSSTLQVTLPAAASAGHTLEVRARDSAGNIDPTPAVQVL